MAAQEISSNKEKWLFVFAALHQRLQNLVEERKSRRQGLIDAVQDDGDERRFAAEQRLKLAFRFRAAINALFDKDRPGTAARAAPG
jgi:hypothetical protein